MRRKQASTRHDSTTRPPSFFSFSLHSSQLLACRMPRVPPWNSDGAAQMSWRCSHDPSSLPRLNVSRTTIGRNTLSVSTRGAWSSQRNQGRRPVTANFHSERAYDSCSQNEASWLAPCSSSPAAIVTASNFTQSRRMLSASRLLLPSEEGPDTLASKRTRLHGRRQRNETK